MKNIFALIVTAFLCSGCALVTSKINIPYKPLAAATPVAGASAVTVSVSATDARTDNRDRVGVKKNGYGMNMAAIVASNNIPNTVRDAFKQELAARGFRIGPSGIPLQIQVVQFYNSFKLGFFAGKAVANVAFNVQMAEPNGSMTFSKYYAGTGVEPGIQIAGGDNARTALIKAFQAAVASTMNDPAFIKALLASGSRAPTT